MPYQISKSEKAYFISPVVDMERLIADMMIWANVTEDELKDEKKKFRQLCFSIIGIIFAAKGKKILLYQGNPNAHFVW